jgi:hypothetical protein
VRGQRGRERRMIVQTQIAPQPHDRAHALPAANAPGRGRTGS